MRPFHPYIADDDPKVFFEPAVIGRVNMMSNHMFFTFQGGLSIPISKTYYEYRPVYLCMGIGFRIGGVRKETVGETN
jgi:hypothetical protein